MSEPLELTGFLAAFQKQVKKILADHIRYAATLHDLELDLEEVMCAVEIRIIGQEDAAAALMKWLSDATVYQTEGRAKKITDQQTGDDWLIIRIAAEEKVSIDRFWVTKLDEMDGEMVDLFVTKLEVTE